MKKVDEQTKKDNDEIFRIANEIKDDLQDILVAHYKLQPDKSINIKFKGIMLALSSITAHFMVGFLTNETVLTEGIDDFLHSLKEHIKESEGEYLKRYGDRWRKSNGT